MNTVFDGCDSRSEWLQDVALQDLAIGRDGMYSQDTSQEPDLEFMGVSVIKYV